MRGISRIFGVSRKTLADWIKKKVTTQPAKYAEHAKYEAKERCFTGMVPVKEKNFSRLSRVSRAIFRLSSY